jgi:hypothetical protein
VTAELADRLAIRELVERWALYRDARDWERFAALWHAPGRMNATWFQGTAEEFIAASREASTRASGSSTSSAATTPRSPATAPSRRRR